MNLYKIIGMRKSVREFQMKPLEDTALVAVQKYQKEMLPLYPDIPYKIEITANVDERMKRGMFTVKAPYYISFLTKSDKNALLNAGYMMEELSLYLASRGIGSCYQGMLKAVKAQDGLEEVLVMAAGYPKHALYREEGTAKRMEAEKVSAFKEEPTPEIMTVLKAALLAPSSLNSQPWRFVVYRNRIHVFMQKADVSMERFKKLHYMDIGMALSHMMIAAEDMWVEAELAESDNISSQSFKRNTYITSFLLK